MTCFVPGCEEEATVVAVSLTGGRSHPVCSRCGMLASMEEWGVELEDLAAAARTVTAIHLDGDLMPDGKGGLEKQYGHALDFDPSWTPDQVWPVLVEHWEHYRSLHPEAGLTAPEIHEAPPDHPGRWAWFEVVPFLRNE